MENLASVHMAIHYSSERPDWETPPDFFDKLNQEFGFNLDVCATYENAKCTWYFTKEDDALQKDWAPNICWMNPPYGREIGKWVKKAFEESQKGARVVCLLPARTDTRWWHDYAIKGNIRFIKGRLKFVGAKKFAPFPNAVVVFDDHTPKG